MKWLNVVGLSVLLAALTSCTAKVYVIDRHTIMEDEAAGEWPNFEKDLLTNAKEMGPMPFSKTELSARKGRLYNVLNGELTDDNQKK